MLRLSRNLLFIVQFGSEYKLSFELRLLVGFTRLDESFQWKWGDTSVESFQLFQLIDFPRGTELADNRFHGVSRIPKPRGSGGAAGKHRGEAQMRPRAA